MFPLRVANTALIHLPSLFTQRSVFLDISELGNHYNHVSDAFRPATFVIPINSNKGEIVVYNRNNTFDQYAHVNDSVARLTVMLRDENGDELSWLSEWEFILSVC